MKATLRATALLGSSSFISVIAAAATSKFYAVHIDAEGIGLSTVMQSVMGMGVLFASLGIPTGLTREVSAAGLRNEVDEQVGALAAAQRITVVTSIVVFGVMLALWPQIASAKLGKGHLRMWEVLSIAVAGGITVWTAVQTSYLNGHQRLGELARLGMVSSLGSAAAGVALVWILGVAGVAPAILATAIISAILARFSIARAKLPVRGGASFVTRSQKKLIRFGVPMMLSSLLGTGVQMFLPLLVVRMLDLGSVGIYRAASSISVTYLGLLVATLSQEYYPRISAAPKETLETLLNTQHKLVLLLGIPIICVGAFASPLLIPILYKTGRFSAAVPVLQWQLIGDLLRLSSWTMGYVILARSGSLAYFLVEVFAGAAFLATSWLGMRWFGIDGMGIGFLCTYVLYSIVVAYALYKTLRIRLDGSNLAAIVGTTALLSLVQIELAKTSTHVAFAVRGAIAVVAVAVCGKSLWTELTRKTEMVA